MEEFLRRFPRARAGGAGSFRDQTAELPAEVRETLEAMSSSSDSEVAEEAKQG